MHIDRTLAPPVRLPSELLTPQPRQEFLSNGIPYYSIEAGTQAITQIELLFRAGSWYQDKMLLSRSTIDLIPEGTDKFSSAELSELLDYHGAYLQTGGSKRLASISLISLNKHLPTLLPLLEEMVKNASFPESDFELHIQNLRQDMLVNLQKVKHISRRKFFELLFGKDHPYGRSAELEDFEKIGRGDLQRFFKSSYGRSTCHIVVAGQIEPALRGWMDQHFGQADWNPGANAPNRSFAMGKFEPTVFWIDRPEATQAAINIGRRTMTRNSPDYLSLRILNVLLGGYFGSRLVANIREEKGYTYGIGSSLLSNLDVGYWVVSTEVGAQHAQATIDEVFKEFRRLREEPVPDEELQRVKNYFAGELQRFFDGPFALLNSFVNVLEHQEDFGFYHRLFDTVLRATPEGIMELAQRYLREEDFLVVVAGPKPGL